MLQSRIDQTTTIMTSKVMQLIVRGMNIPFNVSIVRQKIVSLLGLLVSIVTI